MFLILNEQRLMTIFWRTTTTITSQAIACKISWPKKKINWTSSQFIIQRAFELGAFSLETFNSINL